MLNLAILSLQTHTWHTLIAFFFFPWLNVREHLIAMEYRFLSSLPLFLAYKGKVAVSAGSAGDSVSAHFPVATAGEIGNEPLPSIWQCFRIAAPTPFWWCLWRLNSTTLGAVCTYICRNNVYVSQNRHFLKAVHLKVKLIEPIFSIHLLTLLMCMLNRRSQIWISLTEAGVGKWLYSELGKSCQLNCSC